MVKAKRAKNYIYVLATQFCVICHPIVRSMLKKVKIMLLTIALLLHIRLQDVCTAIDSRHFLLFISLIFLVLVNPYVLLFCRGATGI